MFSELIFKFIGNQPCTSSTSHAGGPAGKLDRRNTVHHIAANLKENQAKGANLDLEREFRKNLKGTSE